MESDFNPVPRKPKPVREKRVESDHRDAVKAAGGLSLKFVSPGRVSVPDRIDLYGIDPMVKMLKVFFGAAYLTIDETAWRYLARDLLASAFQFTEAKRPGAKPTPEQLREHARLRALGFTVNVVDQLRKEK